MEEFLKQVRADMVSRRFYACCANCGRRIWTGRLPLVCRGAALQERLESGRAGKFRQGHTTAAAIRLAGRFNKCPSRGRWVCDGCYILGRDGDAQYNYASGCPEHI